MRNLWWVLTMALAAFLASCRSAGIDAASPAATDPKALFTAAAMTAQAVRLGKGEGLPTIPPAALIGSALAPTSTPQPVGTQRTSTIAFTPTRTSLALVETASGEEAAEFIADVTVPDGSIFLPDVGFVKTWRLKNIGETTWTGDYAMVFLEGELMGGPAHVPLNQEVLPGEDMDVSVDLVSPSTEGEYRGEWKLSNAKSQIFGVGENAQDPFWVDIIVSGSGSTEGRDPATSGGVFERLRMRVDQDEVRAECPHTFVFTTEFRLKQAETVTYQLEAQTPNYVFEIKLPPPQTRNLKAGDHSAVYELRFDNDIQGWVRLVFTQPVGVKSSSVNFQLECN